MTAKNERTGKLQLLEDDIGRSLRESERNGELKSAPSYGRPLSFGDGYDETPDELKMPFKILKDAGFVPPEVEAMREIARLQETLQAATDDGSASALRRKIAELRQHLALRLEKLRISGSL